MSSNGNTQDSVRPLVRVALLVLLALIFCLSVKNSTISTPTITPKAKTQQETADTELSEEALLDEEEEEEILAEPKEDASALLAIAGDVMIHKGVISSSYDSETDSYCFTQFFTYAGDWIASADLAICNLEAPLAGTVSSYPNFSAPDELATDLVTLGFDLVTTANNHCLDKGTSGLLRTLEVLDAAGLAHIGTYASQEEFDQNMGIVVQEVNGISIAFLDYTYGVNNKTVSESYLVNRYNLNTENEYETVAELDTDKLETEMAYARSLDTDLIVVLIHWGTEYITTNSSYQEEIADFLIAQGADAVLGGHSHVPQPMEYRTVTDVDGNLKTGFVCYSLGNLISNMSVANAYYTAILNIEITRTNGVTRISGISYEPMYLLNPGNSSLDTLVLLDIPAAVADYENGVENSYVTESVYNKLLSAQSALETIFGSIWDISYEVLK